MKKTKQNKTFRTIQKELISEIKTSCGTRFRALSIRPSHNPISITYYFFFLFFLIQTARSLASNIKHPLDWRFFLNDFQRDVAMPCGSEKSREVHVKAHWSVMRYWLPVRNSNGTASRRWVLSRFWSMRVQTIEICRRLVVVVVLFFFITNLVKLWMVLFFTSLNCKSVKYRSCKFVIFFCTARNCNFFLAWLYMWRHIYRSAFTSQSER